MILSAGLTPAWQQVLLFRAFVPGEVNRARAVHWCASGKVLNAARALHHLGAPCKALTVVGGTSGVEIRRDCEQLGLAARWIETAAPTRVCTTILDDSRRSATELVPNAEELRDSERSRFLDAYAEEAAAAAIVILIGSLPAGTSTSLYRELCALTPGKVILDARGPELLEALSCKPFVVKPNRDELGRTLGRTLASDAELFDAMRELNERGAEWVVITDGRRPVHVRSRTALHRLQPLEREVLNPIGCGDCMAGALAAALYRSLDPLEAVRYGLAAAADKVGRLLPGEVERTAVEALAGAIEVTRL